MAKQLVVATVNRITDEFVEFADVKVSKKYYTRGYCSPKRFVDVKVHDIIKCTASIYDVKNNTVQLSSARTVVIIKE
jgi:hypothetical protein